MRPRLASLLRKLTLRPVPAPAEESETHPDEH
jgi:hypothetical protein